MKCDVNNLSIVIKLIENEDKSPKIGHCKQQTTKIKTIVILILLNKKVFIHQKRCLQ